VQGQEIDAVSSADPAVQQVADALPAEVVHEATLFAFS
jgi:hypothetical protein